MMKVGGADITAMKHNGVDVTEAKYNGVVIFTLIPEPESDYALTAATQRGWTGYWFNNAGSIEGGSYTFTRPGGSSSVRQTMVQSRTAPLRFAMTTQGLGIDQFPSTITTESGGTSITWTRPSSSFNVGQGSAANYTTTLSNVDVAAVFNDNNVIYVTLDFSAPPVSIPGAVRSLAGSLLRTSPNRAWQVTWLAPSDTGGQGILRYELELQTMIDWVNPQSTTDLTYTYFTSTAITSIDVRVRAVNASGPGPWTVVSLP